MYGIRSPAQMSADRGKMITKEDEYGRGYV